MNWLNKLECYIALGWKGLPMSNTLRFGPEHKLQRKTSAVNTTLGACTIKDNTLVTITS